MFAPGIVGGSKKLGHAQAEEIKQLDPVSGVVAESFVLLNQKDNEALGALFAGLSPELQAHPRVKMAKANYLRSSEQFEPAIELLAELMELPHSGVVDEQKMLPYQAMLQTGFLAMKSEAHHAQGLAAFKRYLDTAPSTYKLTSKKWARFFLGQLYATAGQTELAKSTLLTAKESATDKSLISQIDDALKEI